MTPRSILALLLCGLLPASAQPPAQNAANGPETTLKISTTTQLVVEDVLIKGKDGKPILGLKPSDFTITEDGKAQKISVFEFQSLEGDSGSGKPTIVPPPRLALGPGVKPLTTLDIAPERPGDLKYRNRRL